MLIRDCCSSYSSSQHHARACWSSETFPIWKLLIMACYLTITLSNVLGSCLDLHTSFFLFFFILWARLPCKGLDTSRVHFPAEVGLMYVTKCSSQHENVRWAKLRKGQKIPQRWFVSIQRYSYNDWHRVRHYGKLNDSGRLSCPPLVSVTHRQMQPIWRHFNRKEHPIWAMELIRTWNSELLRSAAGREHCSLLKQLPLVRSWNSFPCSC